MKTLLVNILLLISITANAQSVEENPVAAGAIKKLITKCAEYTTLKGLEKSMEVVYRRYDYNLEGKILSAVTLNLDNSNDSTYTLYTYSGQNLETKKYNSHTNMESDVVEGATEYYEYNDANRLTKRTLVTDGGEKTIYTYSYNESGQLLTMLADSAERKRYTYFYDDLGKVIRIHGETPMINNPGWLLIDSMVYEYDSKNKLVKELHIKEGTERKRSLYEYNLQGKLSKKTVYVYGDTKPVYSIEYTYDEKIGLPTRRTVKSLPDKNKLEYATTIYNYIYYYRK